MPQRQTTIPTAQATRRAVLKARGRTCFLARRVHQGPLKAKPGTEVSLAGFGRFHSVRQPKEGKNQATNLLEVLVFYELHNDVLFGLDLQHLQRQAQEGRRLNVPAINAPHVLQLHGLVHHQLGYEKDGP